MAAQAVLGVTIGGYLQTDALEALGHAWLPVTLVSAGTLGLSIAPGPVLARTTELDRPTAIARHRSRAARPGSSGMARDLGGDDRLVAFMQYLRVLVVVLSRRCCRRVRRGRRRRAAPREAVFASPARLADHRRHRAHRDRSPAALNVPAGMLIGPLLVAGALDARRRRLRRPAGPARTRRSR